MFSDLLNDVLSATQNAGVARIVSEQHNTSQIDIGGGAAASLAAQIAAVQSGGWDAAEYGITAEQRIAQLRATQGNPEALAKLNADMTLRAIRRASLDTSNGRVAVMVAGKAPWHRLGVNVESAVTSADAMRLASLAWTVAKLPLSYVDPITSQPREQKDVFAMVRTDTGAMLGNVGSRYTPIQNAEGFEFLDSVLGQFGARYETAGAIYGGSKVWMLVNLPNQRFAVNGKDSIEPYCLFMNPHDGSGQAWCFPTTERVVCANTFRVASSKRDSRGIGLRHTGNLRRRIADAQGALGVAVKGFERFKHSAEVMTRTAVPSITHYANDVLDMVLDVTAADASKGADLLAAVMAETQAEIDMARKSIAQKIERRGEVLQDILTRYESDKNGVNGMRGTAWSAFNAITEHADHNRIGRQVGSDEARQSRRLESIVAGDADAMKQAAYTVAMSYAGA